MIKGKHVLLRPVEEKDLLLLAQWRNDPRNRANFFSPFLVNPEGQARWYEQLLLDRSRLLLIIELLDGRTVGMVGLNRIDWRVGEAEFGSFLLDPECRGCGYAEEAGVLLINYAFDELNLRRLYSHIYAFNQGAIDLAKLTGFKQEGVLRQAAYAQGRYHDKVIVALLRDEWQGGDIEVGID